MKRQFTGDAGGEREQKLKGPFNKKMKMKMKRNMQRLGGRGLSLETFANSKSGNRNYDPSYIKKQREFYKNAKFVSKYKRSLKQKEQPNNGLVTAALFEGESLTYEARDTDREKKNWKRKPRMTAKELYEKTLEVEQKARIEREAIRRAKEEERQRTEGERKALRAKMLKKTKFGQPVMKYRIEHLLEAIQSSSS